MIHVKQGYVNYNKLLKLIHQSEEKSDVIQMEILTKLVYALQGNRNFKYYTVTVDMVIKKRNAEFQQISQINTMFYSTRMEFQQTINIEYFCNVNYNLLTVKLQNGGSIATKVKNLTIHVSLQDVIKISGFVLKHFHQVESILLNVMLGNTQKRMVVTFPERRKNRRFSNIPQDGPTIIAIETSIVSQQFIDKIITLMPDLKKLLLVGINKANATPVLDFTKANNLKHVVFDFVLGLTEDPFLYAQLEFINTDIKKHEVQNSNALLIMSMEMFPCCIKLSLCF